MIGILLMCYCIGLLNINKLKVRFVLFILVLD